MAYDTAEAQQQLLDALAAAAEDIGFALGALGDAYERLDDAGADQLLGRVPRRRPMKLVAGDPQLLRRFVGRYLKDSSPLATRLGASR